jgi:hypothetical protein
MGEKANAISPKFLSSQLQKKLRNFLRFDSSKIKKVRKSNG